jgi:hypothetical protein
VKHFAIGFLLSVLMATGPYGAQTRGEQTTRQLSEAKEQLVSAAQSYKDSLQKLVPFYEAEVKKATATFEQRKSLFDQGIVSITEVEDSEKALAVGKSKLEEVTKQLTEADTLIAEAMEDKPALIAPPRKATRSAMVIAIQKTLFSLGFDITVASEGAKGDRLVFKGRMDRPLLYRLIVGDPLPLALSLSEAGFTSIEARNGKATWVFNVKRPESWFSVLMGTR